MQAKRVPDWPPAVPYPDPPGFAEAPPRLLFDDQIAAGLPNDSLRRIASMIFPDPVEANRLVHAIVPKSSLSRRGVMTQAQSEQTHRLGRLFGYAFRVFGDMDDARAFMTRPHPELRDRRPVDACMTELGGRAVESVLDSIAFGMPV
jgi:putative toxin-antitoxin system antitoxin component (TIGR02293 family)